MTDDPTLSALQTSLKQYREARQKGLSRMAELEAELSLLRAQDQRLAGLIEQTESALHQALFPIETPIVRRPPMQSQIDMEISAPPRQSPQYQQHYQPPYQPQREERYAPPQYQPPHQPQYRKQQDQSLQYQTAQIEEQVAKARRSERNSNVRFNDFRIPQAATIVLREAGHPLHVNEIYNRMAEGGFEFRGQHQLITLAVSLSRSKRFRKVSPGTFELSPEFLAGQVA
jgi:FtsZ-interacting cell division protein ZipA